MSETYYRGQIEQRRRERSHAEADAQSLRELGVSRSAQAAAAKVAAESARTSRAARALLRAAALYERDGRAAAREATMRDRTAKRLCREEQALQGALGRLLAVEAEELKRKQSRAAHLLGTKVSNKP